jgi:hypothetical protein
MENVMHRAITIPLPDNGSGKGYHWHKLCTLERDNGYGKGLTWDWDEVTCPNCKQVGALSLFMPEESAGA